MSGEPPTADGLPTAAARRARVQRSTVRTLVASQAAGGIGVTSGVAVATVLAESLLGPGSADLAGLANTTQVLGTAVAAIVLAQVAGRWGRRVGLTLGYVAGALGAAVVLIAALSGSFGLLLVGTCAFGSASAANSQARFAAGDLATPNRRGTAISIVVWATTIGAVLGPNLVGPAGRLGTTLGVPALAGPFLLSGAGFVVAAGVLTLALRPDPLLLARRTAAAVDAPAGARVDVAGRSVRSAVGTLRRNRPALGAVAVIALAHTTMVAVMVMTPLHMSHGGAALSVIGFVISVHVLGMYAFSPLVGWASDRLGPRPVMVVGAAVLVLASLLAAASPTGDSLRLTVGLGCLGLGWSCCTVSSSALLTDVVAVADRASVQGLSDLLMGVAAAGGSALAGVVVATVGFAVLGVAGCALGVAVAAVVWLLGRTGAGAAAG